MGYGDHSFATVCLYVVCSEYVKAFTNVLYNILILNIQLIYRLKIALGGTLKHSYSSLQVKQKKMSALRESCCQWWFWESSCHTVWLSYHIVIAAFKSHDWLGLAKNSSVSCSLKGNNSSVFQKKKSSLHLGVLSSLLKKEVILSLAKMPEERALLFNSYYTHVFINIYSKETILHLFHYLHFFLRKRNDEVSFWA